MSDKLVGVSLLVRRKSGIPAAICEAARRNEGVSIKPADKGKRLIIRLEGAKAELLGVNLRLTMNHGSYKVVDFPGTNIITHGPLRGWPTQRITQGNKESTCRVCEKKTGIPQWDIMKRSPKRRSYKCSTCGSTWVRTR